MKKFCLSATIAVFFLICTNGIQAQTTKSTLNQLELAKHFLGTWQANIGKDTVEVWDSKLYGNAVIINVSRMVKGEKTHLYKNNISFDSNDGKLKGFILNTNATNTTWMGSFTTDKDFSGVLVYDFKPDAAWAKFAFVFTNPKEWVFTTHNMEGVKLADLKFSKVK